MSSEFAEDAAELQRLFQQRLQSGAPPQLRGTELQRQFRLRAPHGISVALLPADFNSIVSFCGDEYSDCFIVMESESVWSEWDAFNV